MNDKKKKRFAVNGNTVVNDPSDLVRAGELVHCRANGNTLGIADNDQWTVGQEVSFMYMPAGVHTINAGFRGKAVNLTVQIIPEETTPVVQASLEQLCSEAPKQKPFGCVEHDERDASLWPKRFEAREDGVYLAAEPSALGADHVNGKIHRSWSPSFYTDAEYDKAKCSDCRKPGGNCACTASTLLFPEGARGSTDNPARITGVGFVVGTLTNKPAFRAIAPVKAKEVVTSAENPRGVYHKNQAAYRSGLAKTSGEIYHAPSAEAHRASQRAYESGAPEDHHAASMAHYQAKRIADTFRQGKLSKEHQDLALTHHEEMGKSLYRELSAAGHDVKDLEGDPYALRTYSEAVGFKKFGLAKASEPFSSTSLVTAASPEAVKHRGVNITTHVVPTRFGPHHIASNDYGEPKVSYRAFKSRKAAIENEKRELDAMAPGSYYLTATDHTVTACDIPLPHQASPHVKAGLDHLAAVNDSLSKSEDPGIAKAIAIKSTENAFEAAEHAIREADAEKHLHAAYAHDLAAQAHEAVALAAGQPLSHAAEYHKELSTRHHAKAKLGDMATARMVNNNNNNKGKLVMAGDKYVADDGGRVRHEDVARAHLASYDAHRQSETANAINNAHHHKMASTEHDTASAMWEALGQNDLAGDHARWAQKHRDRNVRSDVNASSILANKAVVRASGGSTIEPPGENDARGSLPASAASNAILARLGKLGASQQATPAA